MKNIAWERGALPRMEGGRPSAPVHSSFGSALRRLVGAALVSSWAPVIGKAIVGMVALLALAAVGNAALTRPANASSLPSAAHGDSPKDGLAEAPVALPVASSEAPHAPAQAPTDTEPVPKASPVLPDGRVVLNLAGENELTKLPGIGPKRAQAIITLRQRLGRFRRVEDLLRVKGIGKKMLTRLRSAVVLDVPTEPD